MVGSCFECSGLWAGTFKCWGITSTVGIRIWIGFIKTKHGEIITLYSYAFFMEWRNFYKPFISWRLVEDLRLNLQ